MRRVLLVAALLGCAPRPARIQQTELGTCIVWTDVTPSDHCDGLLAHDADGDYPCVQCRSAGRCVDPDLEIYCAWPDCGDPRCGP